MEVDLKQLEKEYTKALKDAHSIATTGATLGATVKRWLALGKTGQTTVIALSKELKDKENELALNVVNTACKRFFSKEGLNLSIKGLGFKTENGKKQEVEITPKVKPTNTGNTKTGENKPEFSTSDFNQFYKIAEQVKKEGNNKQLAEMRVEALAFADFVGSLIG